MTTTYGDLTMSHKLADAYCRGRNTQGGYPCDGLCDSCRSRTTNAEYDAAIERIRLIMAAPTVVDTLRTELSYIRLCVGRARQIALNADEDCIAVNAMDDNLYPALMALDKILA